MRSERPEFENLALDVEEVARSLRVGLGDFSAGPGDPAGERSEEMRALASIREIEQDFATDQSMSKSLVKASRRIDCGDRCAKLVAGN
jgi:hypothetical protein